MNSHFQNNTLINSFEINFKKSEIHSISSSIKTNKECGVDGSLLESKKLAVKFDLDKTIN